MDNLNLRHLYYFWVISREGSITNASEVLDLTPQTLSGQLASLEDSINGRLFTRKHRQLKPFINFDWKRAGSQPHSLCVKATK